MLKTLVRAALVASALAAASLGVSAAPVGVGDVRIGASAAPAGALDVAQRYERRSGRRDVCAPGQAIRKAGRLGLRRAHIVRDTRRAVVVDGFKRGRLVTVRFAQVRGCPVLGVR